MSDEMLLIFFTHFASNSHSKWKSKFKSAQINQIVKFSLHLASKLVVLHGVPSEEMGGGGVPRTSTKLYSFNPQMHKQQQPLL